MELILCKVFCLYDICGKLDLSLCWRVLLCCVAVTYELQLTYFKYLSWSSWRSLAEDLAS